MAEQLSNDEVLRLYQRIFEQNSPAFLRVVYEENPILRLLRNAGNSVSEPVRRQETAKKKERFSWLQ